MNGIMSGINDRKNFAVGSENIESLKQYAKELEPAMQEIIGPYEKPTGFQDPLYQLGISLGLDLMSKADSQSLLRNIGAAGARQTPQFFKSLAEERAAKRDYDRGIKTGAIGLAGDILGREITASGKTPPPDKILESRIGSFLESGLPANVAERAAKFERAAVGGLDDLRSNTGNARSGGIIEFDLSDPEVVKQNEKLLKRDYDNTVVYDPFEDNFKYIKVIDGELFIDEFSSIDNIVIRQPELKEEDKGARPSYGNTPMFGLDMDDPQA